MTTPAPYELVLTPPAQRAIAVLSTGLEVVDRRPPIPHQACEPLASALEDHSRHVER